MQSIAKFNRSAAITNYAAGNVVGDGNLRLFGTPDRAAYLKTLRVTYSPTNAAPVFRVYLFSQDPTGVVTTLADYATMFIPATAFTYYEGFIDVATSLGGNVASGISTTTSNFVIPKTPNNTLYAVIATQSLYAPSASDNIAIRMSFEFSN